MPETKSPEGATAEKTTEAEASSGDQTLPALTDVDQTPAERSVTAMMNVDLDVQVVLGSTRMPISQLLELTRGSIVELDRKIGAPVELIVSERVVARGDLVKVGENRLGVSLTQIVRDHVSD